MSKSHNKKRTTSLLMEFLTLSISDALVKGDNRRAQAALRIVKRHFKPGSELHREHRLASALVRTTVSSEAVATSILGEAKRAARTYDAAKLDREKSLLISSINKALADPDFYDRHVHGYRAFATVQTLLNDWRSPAPDIGRVAVYEDELVKWLLAEKPEPADASVPADGNSRLVVRAMMKRLNERYEGQLTGDQKRLLREHAFSEANGDVGPLRAELAKRRDELVGRIDAELAATRDERVKQKLAEARVAVASEALESVDDEAVTRFMLYSKLAGELAGD